MDRSQWFLNTMAAYRKRNRYGCGTLVATIKMDFYGTQNINSN